LFALILLVATIVTSLIIAPFWLADYLLIALQKELNQQQIAGETAVQEAY